MFANVDRATSQTSSSTNVENLDKAIIKVSWTGTSPVGVIEVQKRLGSLDAWTTVNMGSAISISGNSGSHDLLFNEMPGTELQLVYTSTSGTGNLTATISAKVLGA
jgi:hypothetical protein